MDNVEIFWMQLLTSIVVFGVVARWYVWPYLSTLPRNSALIPLLFVHVPRYVGMTFISWGYGRSDTAKRVPFRCCVW